VCDGISGYTILFWGQNSGTSFNHQSLCQAGSHHPWQHVTESNVMTHLCVPFCACPSAVEETNNKLSGIPFLYYLLDCSVFEAKLCYDFPNHHSSVFCDEHINLLLLAFHGDGSWSTAVRQISNVSVAISEAFYPTSTHCRHS
jgi:hypothetical protein